jgi:hypothetical protein
MVIDADVKNVSVEMRGPNVLSGFVDWDTDASAAPSFSATAVPLTLVPAAPGLSPSTKMKIDSSGEFVQPNLIPGRYYVRVGVLPPGAFLKTITADGRNALDAPIDLSNGNVDSVSVVLTDRATEIAGSVRGSGLLPAWGAAVIVVPGDSTAWTPNRSRYVRASTNGVYAIRGLPAGDYLIVAVDDASIEGLQDTRVLSQLRTLATRVRLHDAENVLLHLNLAALRR